ncbi:MAG TPA: C25 family cysteine peptidase [Verrucomicrobiota bacterium]|nr:C25 family cysteine peptidase [Verrucomicrobiota bacterium]
MIQPLNAERQTQAEIADARDPTQVNANALPPAPSADRRTSGLWLVLAAAWLCPTVAQAETTAPSITTRCDFEFPRLQQSAGEHSAYIQVRMDGCDVAQRVGAPVLPFRTIRLLLPPGGRVEKVEALAPQPATTIPGTWQVDYGRLPVTTPSVRMLDLARADQPDPTIYGSDGLYPAVGAELVAVQRLAGYDLAVIRVYPVRYRPARGELQFTPSLQVVLTPKAESAQPQPPIAPRRAQLRARDRVAAWVDNPALLQTYAAPSLMGRAGGTLDYLLVTRSNLVSAFQPLVDRKAQSGLAVKVETVETIVSAQPGADIPERIRNYIRTAYADWGITYVLLGGDATVVPCRYAHAFMNLPEIDSRIPCDLYYACLDGPWNADGDDRWGEPTDGSGSGDVDLLAEVFVGRAPVDTPEEVATFVDKCLRYETFGHPQANHFLLVAEFLKSTPNGPAHGGDMFEPLLPYLAGRQVTWLDDRPFTTPQWTKSDLQAALNGSPHLALFNGHGDDEVLMSSHLIPSRGIRTDELDALTNAFPFLAYSVGCNVGQFDNDRWSPDAIGEELVKRNAHGAFAAVFNSRLGWYDPVDESKYSGEFQTRFFAHLLAHGQTNFGVANQFSKHDLVGQIESSGLMPYRWCYYEITLLGDPHLAWHQPIPSPDQDTDGDGMTDLAEQVAGTSPTDPASVLSLRAARGSGLETGVRLEWPSVQGRQYSIFHAPDPAGPYARLAQGLAATPPLNVYEDTGPDNQPRFYRIEVQTTP